MRFVPECRGHDVESVHLYVAATHRVARKELDLTDGSDPNEANCSQTCDAGVMDRIDESTPHNTLKITALAYVPAVVGIVNGTSAPVAPAPGLVRVPLRYFQSM